MLKRVFRAIITTIGLILGYVVGDGLLNVLNDLGVKLLQSPISKVVFLLFVILVFGIILYFISPTIYKGLNKIIDTVEKSVQKVSASELVYGTVGTIVALLIASLVGIPVLGIHPIAGPILFVLIELVAVVIGIKIFVEKKDDINIMIGNMKKSSSKDKKHKNNTKNISNVLDTSVIIDGRIFDICKTGFIAGTLIIPSFVLDELRHISDSSDALKRNRGRRGLDILNKIQKELEIETEVWEGDFPEIAEVDSKLLKLAQTLNGKVITNDYNLNKVAEVQGVPVLNINELANAVKPVVLPGEEMKVVVNKEGKESSQGIAYLDDGTMIVVEGGKKFIGEQLDVIVTSVLQTAAGRMIFAKQKEN